MISCIAIDDEPLALRQMSTYISKTPFLVLKAQFDNALDAYEYLQNHAVDLMFVDINMPDLNGMDFVKSLQRSPKVIFTTAYSEYALEGFKVDAVDYLLKPIGYSDFLKAVTKARERLGITEAVESRLESTDDFLFIKTDYKIVRLNLHDITYIESMREYVRVHLVHQKPVMTLQSMKKMEAALPGHQFMRVHRSYIVNLNRITTVERLRIIFDDKTIIPVSDHYKEKFQEYLDRHFLL